MNLHQQILKKWWPYIVGGTTLALVAGVSIGSSTYRGHERHQPTTVATRPVKRHASDLDYSPITKSFPERLATGKKRPKLNSARAAIAIDAHTGNILYAKNINRQYKVASLAKLMTLYLVERKASRDNAWNQPVSAAHGRQLRRLSYDKNGLGGFKFKKGHRYTVKDLFTAALVPSSNNAAIALAQWAGGTNRNFVKLMNKQAKIWGLKANFVSASGLENDDLSKYHLNVKGNRKAGNEISAKDLAIISYHLIGQFPSILNTADKPQVKLDGQVEPNENRLLKGKDLAKPGLNVDGLKTGFTNDAGYCFVGTEKPKQGPRIITVVLHDNQDFPDTAKLMTWLNSYESRKLG